MTLEEAIKHAEEKVKCGGECGEDHAQLAGWLKELRERRVAEPEKRTAERTETHACDCISRQAAIDALIRKIRPHNNGGGTITMCVMSEELVRKTLNEVPSAQQWIPCSERLPEVHWFDRDICYSDTVLVTEETKHGSKDVKMGYRTTEGGGEIWWDAREGAGFAGEIIAWMPLPEPWGGEQDE